MAKAPNVDRLKKMGIFTASEVEKKLGISQPTLSRWAKAGLIDRVARGIYQHPDSQINPQTQDFSIACKLFGPRSAIGGLSALFHYRLIEQVPHQIWVIVPPSIRSSTSLYRLLRTQTPTKHGIVRYKEYRITDLERTLVESLKFAGKIGPRIAIQAARRSLEQGLTSEAKLGRMAEKLGLEKVLDKYWEALVS